MTPYNIFDDIVSSCLLPIRAAIMCLPSKFRAPKTFLISVLYAIATMATMAAVTGCGSGEGSGDNGDEQIEIVITSPEADSFHSRSRVNVAGTAQGTSEVEVNGTVAPVESGEWEVMLSFEDGEVTATATAGQAEASVDFIVDTQYPEIVIENPQRGTMLHDEIGEGQASIFVTGHVANTGPSGMALFQVGGATLEVDEGDSFEHEIMLDEGLNIITVTAVDRAHNRRDDHRAVIFGPLTDPDSPIEEAVRADIYHPSGTDALTEVIESYITPEQLEGFLGDDLELDGGISVEVHELTWDDLDVELRPRDGYLTIEITIEDLFVAGAFNFGSSPINGDITINEVVLTLDIVLAADEDNQLDVDIIEDNLSLGDITVNIEGEESDEAALLVAAAIGYAFHEFMEELLVDNLYDPDLLTQEFEFLDRTITITLLLEEIFIGPGGIIARLGISFPGDKSTYVPDVPGALNREVHGSPGGGISRPMLFHTHRTALERIVHALWQSGLFHQAIGEDDGIDMPFDLTAGGLAVLLDSRIRDIHDSDTPIELRLRPLLPPVAEFGQEREATVEVGDFLIDFYLIPDESTETLFLTLSFQLFVDLEFDIGQDEVDLDLDIDLKASIVEEPVFTFDPDDTLSLIDQLMSLIPDLVLSDLSISPETTLEWLTIGNPEVEFNQDYLSVGIELEPAEDFIEEDVVEPGDD